ncbi:MAG: hypothetical protein IT355_19710 [Gemmatimonadaceae bacterium]|nr:hypothetical protein [Gemmatimonadaceae bacterium]
MPRLSRATLFLALTLCATVAAACGDPFAVKAPFQTVTDSFAISALTGTPPTARALWRIGQFTRYRLDSVGATFDLGFDVDAAGRITVYPARTIAVPPPGTVVTPPRVALQASSGAYAQADRAPETGYTVDTAVVVSQGQLVFVRSNSDFCLNQGTGGTLLFAKLVVDSVNTTTRVLHVRSTIQPSCNFRSFATGVPTF